MESGSDFNSRRDPNSDPDSFPSEEDFYVEGEESYASKFIRGAAADVGGSCRSERPGRLGVNPSVAKAKWDYEIDLMAIGAIFVVG